MALYADRGGTMTNCTPRRVVSSDFRHGTKCLSIAQHGELADPLACSHFEYRAHLKKGATVLYEDSVDAHLEVQQIF